jgi:uncharacterized membrane protein
MTARPRPPAATDDVAGSRIRAHRHPVNRRLLDEAPAGARLADAVAGFLGSWRFIVLQTIVVTVWVAGNVALLFHFDPYPFILLNLAFSTQAAYAAPLILLASNRSAMRDRLTLEHAAAEADIEERQNLELLARAKELGEQLARLELVMARLERQFRDGSPPT